MPTIFMQSGPENSGKTTTIRLLYELLRDAFPDAVATHVLDKGADVRAVLTIGTLKVGIESQGDPWKKQARLEPSLTLFLKLRCEIIVVATRTYGGTVESVEGLEDDGYQVVRRDRAREKTPAAQVQCNRAEAVWMLGQIQQQLFTAAA